MTTLNKFLSLLFLLIFTFGCTPGENGVPEQEETPDPYAYDGFAEVDSLLLADVDIPEVINLQRYDSTTVSVFKSIADDTDGKLYFAENAELVVETVIEIIENQGTDNADICFLVDKTGSMQDDIMMMIASMDLIFGAIETYSNVNVAMAYYGDKNVDGSRWYESIDFTTDYDKVRAFWGKYKPSNGGDAPESVTDGAYRVVNELSWSSTSKRIILMLGDAPPLEAPLSDYSVDDIVRQANEKDIVSNYYPVVVGFGWMEPGPVKSDLIAGIYPNPAQKYTNLVLTSDEMLTVEVYGADGSLKESFASTDTKHQFDVSDYAAGVYVVRVSAPDGSKTDNIKFIKE